MIYPPLLLPTHSFPACFFPAFIKKKATTTNLVGREEEIKLENSELWTILDDARKNGKVPSTLIIVMFLKKKKKEKFFTEKFFTEQY